MNADTLRVGFVGAGRMSREHLRAFADVPGVRLAGIASRTPARAAALASEFGIADVCGTVEEMVAACRPDLVVVAVSEMSAVPVLRECIAQGRPILTEKPVGLDAQDCRSIRDAAGAASVPVWVGLNRRCYGGVLAAKTSLAREPGKRLIEIRDQEDTRAARAAGRTDRVVQHWMFANSIHLIDLFPLFGRGAVESVNVIDSWNGGESALVSARLQFSSGDVGMYRAVWNMPGPWSCSVTAPAQYWELAPLEQARKREGTSRVTIDIAPDPWDQAFKPGFRRQAGQVVDAVRTGVAPEDVPDIEQALVSTELVARIYGLE